MSKTDHSRRPLDRLDLLERLRRKIQAPVPVLDEFAARAMDGLVRPPSPGRISHEFVPPDGRSANEPAGRGDFSSPSMKRKWFNIFGRKLI